jgi:single-strand DNA-binding protein
MSRGSINKVIIIGSLGNDPEMRYLPNGNAVVSIGIATDEGYKDKNTGQQVDKTEWHRVEAFGRLAEVMGEYLKKGSKCYIEGKLRTDEYEKDGIKRYSTKIIANEMTMLDSKPQGQQQGQQGYAQQPQQAPQMAPQQSMQQAPQQPQYAPQQAHAYGQPQNNGYSQAQSGSSQMPNPSDPPF